MIFRKLGHKIVLGVALVASSFAFAKNLEGPSETRFDLLKSLYTHQFFKNANCADVSSTILENIGLPGIAKKNTRLAGRGTHDRSRDNEPRPIFLDQILNDGTSITLKSSAVEDHGFKKFIVVVDRSKKVRSGVAVLNSKIVFSLNKADLCEFERVEFASKQIHLEGNKNNNVVSMPLNDCLDLFLIRSGVNNFKNKDDLALIDWMKNDCTFGMRFSSEAKSILTTQLAQR